ncbi:MAG: hypothetical protein OEY29_14495 [Gammaproteobacteria bacterium]|nr:hypothetical protein [Gammaproteobacteria bacterium]
MNSGRLPTKLGGAGGIAESVRNEELKEIQQEQLKQLKILNAYMAEGFDETLTEEDIHGN